MVSVLNANLTSYRVGFVLCCFYTRATLVVLYRGENGTAVLSNWVSARKIENSCILGYWLLNVTIWGVCISILFCFFEAILEVCFFWNAFLENFSIFFSRRGRELLEIRQCAQIFPTQNKPKQKQKAKSIKFHYYCNSSVPGNTLIRALFHWLHAQKPIRQPLKRTAISSLSFFLLPTY